MSRRGNRKGVASVVETAATPATADSPRKPRLSELSGSIPITDTARIAAALNREALLDAIAKAIFTQSTTTPPVKQSA